MRAALMSFCAKALLMSGVALLPVVAGCGEGDETQADRRIDEKLVDAQGARGEERLKLVGEAAGEQQASAAGKATAKAAQAQAELEMGMKLMAEAERQQIDLMRVAGQVQQLGESLRLSNDGVGRFTAMEPKAALAKVDEEIALAQGGAGKAVWFAEGEMKLPTLSAAEAEVKRLGGEVAKKNEQIKGLEEQRKAAGVEADRLMAQAEQQKGAESVATHKKGSEARKKASDLAGQIQQARDELVPLEGQLAAVTAQRDAVAGAVEKFKEHKRLIEQTWQATQEQADKQTAAAKRVYGSAGGGAAPATQPGVSLEASIRELDAQAGQGAETAKRAEDYFTAAVTHFDEAETAARQAVLELSKLVDAPENRERPERKAWTGLKELYEPMGYHLQQAKARRLLGDLKAIQAAVLRLRAGLAGAVGPALEKAVIATPAQLGDAKSLGAKADEAYAEASKAYEQAVEKYTDFDNAGTATAELKTAAQVGRMLALYSWGQLAKAKGDEKAKDHIAQAVTLSRQLAQEGARMPVGLPAELAPAVAAPAGATTTPAAAPATVPAEATTAPAAEAAPAE